MKKRAILSSIGITLSLIILIVLAGPAEAISIKADTEKVTYETNEDITIEISVDTRADENINTLTFVLNGIDVCTFDKDANIISGCNNIKVELDEKIGYPDIMFNYRLILKNLTEGRYKGFIRANEENVLSKLINFIVIKQPRPRIERQVAIHGNNGDIENFLGETGFNNHKTSFQMQLREVSDNGKIQGAGFLILDSIGKKDDSTRANLHIRVDPMTIESFTQDSLLLKGPGSLEYHRTKKGVWSTGIGWVGSEQPIRIRRDLSSITIAIDLRNELVDISSNSEEKFSIQDIDITQLKIN